MPLSVGLKILSLAELKDLYAFRTDRQVEAFLKALHVPILRTPDPENTGVLRSSFEAAMVQALLPFGDGLDLRELSSREDPMEVRPKDLDGKGREYAVPIPPPVKECWEELRRDPILASLFNGLASLMYGSMDEQDLKKRLWVLGDLLVSHHLRGRALLLNTVGKTRTKSKLRTGRHRRNSNVR